MENSRVLILSVGKLYLAEMAKGMLEANDIEALLINKQDSVYLIGDIEVYVKPDDVIRAKFLIKDI